MLSAATPALSFAPVVTGWRRLRRARPNLILLAAILVWTCVTRLPLLHVVQDDEAFYSVVASRWLRGELPYVASFDVKAPGVFALFAIVQAVFGASLYVVKGVEIVFVALGALGLYRLLARHATARSAWWAAFLYPLYCLTLNGVGSPCEIVQAALKIWAFAWLADAMLAQGEANRIRFAVLSGLMIGLAVTLKQTAVFEGAALFGGLAWQAWKRREAWPLALFAVAGAAPTLVFAAYFFVHGHLADLYRDVVTLAYRRSQMGPLLPPAPWYVELTQRCELLIYVMTPLAVVTLGVLLAALRRQRLARVGDGCVIGLGLIWYVAAMASIMINRAPDPRYVTALIAPSLLLFSLVVCEGTDFSAPRRAAWLLALGLLAAGAPLVALRVSLQAAHHSNDPDYTGMALAAKTLRTDGARPGDNLLVVSRGHYIYVLSGLLPRAKYFNAMHLLCDFPTPDPDTIATAFVTRPDYVVLSDPRLALSCASLARMNEIKARLARDYSVMTTVHGDWDSFILYRRKTP